MHTLVTGAAGFIGFHLIQKLIERGDTVVGLDNINDYYDPKLKHDRLDRLSAQPGFEFVRADLADSAAVNTLFAKHSFERVIHLGAQAGVRYSIENPRAYIDANIVGFMNILEGCRARGVPHLSYASSSSVYGANKRQPFSEQHNVDHPVSLYAASKKSNELMAHTYSHLFNLPTTGLRFFTVYGPWGRPDMAYFKFVKRILAGEPIDVYNHGQMSRDFTYIDDIVEGVVRVSDKVPTPDATWSAENPNPASSYAPYRIYNIGNNSPVSLLSFIETIEDCLGKKATKNLLPMQDGDVPSTYADVSALNNDTGFTPSTPLHLGIKNFVDWYRAYYQI